jgi:hypothetical protein
MPGSAEARVAVKAIRFRAARVQFHASGVLPPSLRYDAAGRTACDTPQTPENFAVFVAQRSAVLSNGKTVVSHRM